MKVYVTFGQLHQHVINGKTLDKDTVAIIKAESADKGREIAEELFGHKYSMSYSELTWNKDWINYYKRYVEL